MAEKETPDLKRTLGPLMLWGLGVGYVISGMYFGWNLGLEKGGTLGLAVATFFVIIMYITFTFSYTEMACAIPRAGGAFDYAYKALGKHWGFFGGMAKILNSSSLLPLSHLLLAPTSTFCPIYTNTGYSHCLIPGVYIFKYLRRPGSCII